MSINPRSFREHNPAAFQAPNLSFETLKPTVLKPLLATNATQNAPVDALSAYLAHTSGGNGPINLDLTTLQQSKVDFRTSLNYTAGGLTIPGQASPLNAVGLHTATGFNGSPVIPGLQSIDQLAGLGFSLATGGPSPLPTIPPSGSVTVTPVPTHATGTTPTPTPTPTPTGTTTPVTTQTNAAASTTPAFKPGQISAKSPFFAKSPLLPKYQHQTQPIRRDAQGRFVGGKNGKYAPSQPGWYSRYGGKDFSTKTFKTNGSLNPKDWTKTRNYQPKPVTPKVGKKLALAQWAGTKQFFGANNTVANGHVQYRYGAWGNASGIASIDHEGLKLAGAAEVKIGAEGTVKTTLFGNSPLPTTLSATGFAGARADIGAEATFTASKVALSGQASAFAGVEAKLDAKTNLHVDGKDLGNVDVNGGVTAGIGAQGEATASYDHGKVRLALGGKFALGVGLSFKVDTTIDVPNVISVGKHEATKAWHFVQSIF